MIIALLVILILVLILPFKVKMIESNLEIFLLVMGFISTIISKNLNLELFSHILKNNSLYGITAAVLISGILFKIFIKQIRTSIKSILSVIPIKIFIAIVIIALGLISSVITAIIAALVLVEIISVLPLDRKEKIKTTVIACFSIGLGAALTPLGEPLSTIVVARLNEDFFYLLRSLGIYIIPGVVGLGIIGALLVSASVNSKSSKKFSNWKYTEITEEEDYTLIFIRTLKIFLFIIALELLGKGFRPLIDLYIVKLDSLSLYWINITSAILDNATLASAEISSDMTSVQIKAILMGLLISGGMLIPGNIPNIISAEKLEIKSGEWAKVGIPLGLLVLVVYFIVLFIL